MSIWHNRALELYKKGLTKKKITEVINKEFDLSVSYATVRSFLLYRAKQMKNVEKKYETPPVVVQNLEPNHIKNKWDGTRVITFGLMGDTQMGSKYAQISYLHEFAQRCI